MSRYYKNYPKKKPCCFILAIASIAVLILKQTIELDIYFEPWEQSIPGDFATCTKFLPLLLETNTNNGYRSSKIFSWPTPKFANLLLRLNQSKDLDQTQTLRDILCSRYNYTRNKILSDIKITTPFQSESLTSASRTFYKVHKNVVEVGETLHLKIYARDSNGGATANGGGDFFKIRLENSKSTSSVAASKIAYFGNGEYNVEIKTFWNGKHKIKVFLGQSGHFIDFAKRLTSKKFSDGISILGEFQSKNLADRTSCHVNTLPFDSKRKVCNYSGINGEGWFCVRPVEPLRCEDLKTTYTNRSQTSLDLLTLFPFHDRGTSNRQTINGIPHEIVVNDMDEIEKEYIQNKRPKCRPGLKAPSPAGYWINGLWISRVCENFHYSVNNEQAKRCLQNRTFYFIGDSTVRQWFEYFLKSSHIFDQDAIIAKETSKFINVWDPRTAVIPDLNTILYFRSHGPPLQNGGIFASTRFTSTQLDEIGSLSDRGSKLTVAIALGPHFLLYNPDVFLERITTIKDAALRLLSRNPLATVIFKGTSTFIRGINQGECCLTDWLSFRFHKIAKHVFDGTSIIYLDVWDMTVSHVSEDLIHPVQKVVANQLDMALSFSCSSS